MVLFETHIQYLNNSPEGTSCNIQGVLILQNTSNGQPTDSLKKHSIVDSCVFGCNLSPSYHQRHKLLRDREIVSYHTRRADSFSLRMYQLAISTKITYTKATLFNMLPENIKSCSLEMMKKGQSSSLSRINC